MKIFISHSSADEALASALVDLLLASMVLDDEDIRCSSVSGHKFSVGTDFSTAIREELGQSIVVVGLLTSISITSSWVLFELGATWGAKRRIMSLLVDEVHPSSLPGPLGGQHVARLSSKTDLAQLIGEIVSVTGAKARAQSRVERAIADLMAANALYSSKPSIAVSRQRIHTTENEPKISGMPFSELLSILRSETILVPAKIAEGDKDLETNLLTVFVNNASTFADGLQSNWKADTPAGFMYHTVGLKLVPYGLVQFEKIPAAQAKFFKRLVASSDGNKFLLHYKRIKAKPKQDDA